MSPKCWASLQYLEHELVAILVVPAWVRLEAQRERMWVCERNTFQKVWGMEGMEGTINHCGLGQLPCEERDS